MTLLTLLLLCFSSGADETGLSIDSGTPHQRGLALALKMDEVNGGYQGDTAAVEMKLINARGKTATRKLRSKRMEAEGGSHKMMLYFVAPGDVKGVSLLTWSHDYEEDQQWLYLPSTRRVKRITSANKTGSFLGSEFSYEDIAEQEVHKFEYALLEADATFNDRPVWVLERRAKIESGYSKVVLHVDKEYYRGVKLEYYDRKGDLMKVSTVSGWEKFDRWWRSKTTHMVNKQTRKETILTWSDRKLGLSFDEGEFEVAKLKTFF